MVFVLFCLCGCLNHGFPRFGHIPEIDLPLGLVADQALDKYMSEQRRSVEERRDGRYADTLPAEREPVDPRRLAAEGVHLVLEGGAVPLRALVGDDLEAHALDVHGDALGGVGGAGQHPRVVGPVPAALPVVPHLGAAL